MDILPLLHEPRAYPFDFSHDPPHVGLANTNYPIERETFATFQRDLRLTASTEDMHVRRAMIICEDHKPEAESSMHRHHVI
jgi:hypothetical protein